MRPEDARVHALHYIDRAAGNARALQHAIDAQREIVDEAISVGYLDVAREKCEGLATFWIPRCTREIQARITDAREMLDIGGR